MDGDGSATYLRGFLYRFVVSISSWARKFSYLSSGYHSVIGITHRTWTKMTTFLTLPMVHWYSKCKITLRPDSPSLKYDPALKYDPPLKYDHPWNISQQIKQQSRLWWTASLPCPSPSTPKQSTPRGQNLPRILPRISVARLVNVQGDPLEKWVVFVEIQTNAPSHYRILILKHNFHLDIYKS